MSDSNFNSSGDRVLIASDREVRIHETKTGAVVRRIAEDRYVDSAEFNDTGTQLVVVTTAQDQVRVRAAGFECDAHIWSIDAEKALLVNSFHHLRSNPVVSRDGRRIVTLDGTGPHVWDSVTGKPGCPAHMLESANKVALSPDGQLLITDSSHPEDGTAESDLKARHWLRRFKTWNIQSGKLLVQWDDTGWLRAMSPDGRYVLIDQQEIEGHAGALIRDVRTGDPVCFIPDAEVGNLTWSPDGRMLLLEEGSRTRVWSLVGSIPAQIAAVTPSTTGQVQFSADRRRILTASKPEEEPDAKTADQAALWQVWDGETMKALTPPMSFRAAAHVDSNFMSSIVIMSENGSVVATVESDWSIHTWRADSGMAAGPPIHHDAPARSVAVSLSSSGEQLALAVQTGEKTILRLWDVPSGRQIGKNMEIGGPGATCGFRGDLFGAISGGRQRGPDDYEFELSLFNRVSGASVVERLGHGGDIPFHWERNPDGTVLTTFSSKFFGNDTTIRVWDMRSGQLRKAAFELSGSFSGRSATNRILTIDSPIIGDGQWVRVWDGESGHPVTHQIPHDRPSHGDITSDGARAATIEDNNKLRLWDAATGELLSPLLDVSDGDVRVTKKVTATGAMAMSLDGHRVVTESEGKVSVWAFPETKMSGMDAVRLAQFVAHQRLDDTGHLDDTKLNDEQGTWDELKAILSEFWPSDSDVQKWHQHQAEVAEANGYWFSARFHFDQLIRMRPDDQALRNRRSRADAAWTKEVK